MYPCKGRHVPSLEEVVFLSEGSGHLFDITAALYWFPGLLQGYPAQEKTPSPRFLR